MRSWLLPLFVLAACDVPQPTLMFSFSDGPAQECPSTNCLEIPMSCKAWLSIRMIDPAVPETPFYSQCEEIPANSKMDACRLNNVNLEPHELPLRDLEIQVSVYPESMITFDPETMEPICPTDIRYDAANGFPVDGAWTPALGGRSYYRPGDETTLVTLGCSNRKAIDDEACMGPTSRTHVSATVDDFDTRISVGSSEADRLTLSVGTPRPSGTEWILPRGDVDDLDRLETVTPAWGVDVDYLFNPHACLSVLDDAAQSTTTLTCKYASLMDEEIDFTVTPGIRLTNAALDQILAAVSITEFPAEGITIGLVLDRNGTPRPGIHVSASATDDVTPTITYLSSDRTTSGGTATSSGQRGAVFVSTDAPFGTKFSASIPTPPQTVTALGGRVTGKVTIVVLRFNDPIVGG